ncbi:hypothetical protein MYCTH_2129802 [Thermothelomyces thermophilus ATCC 42464]|uniref:Uncharacterized protein n=1 Tax=Thermothelomyces thermophilus (strain ATCC 42464 / BCRC 31852 / DSM 1799) TaxID=573729 RepID=G2QL43_THET4|nr:uncharacterized protein MYCTH_2129802 [Thermothelomyces thermophilus ATCC 42464]AEO60675.1 hypothetical protein MYCTH_2129802 [Thermothelomyces thermophilus ATCC 42464]
MRSVTLVKSQGRSPKPSSPSPTDEESVTIGVFAIMVRRALVGSPWPFPWLESTSDAARVQQLQPPTPPPPPPTQFKHVALLATHFGGAIAGLSPTTGSRSLPVRDR